MRRITMVLLGILLLIALLSFTATFSVRFTEAAVKTRFGKAREGAVIRESGLYFKFPYPIESVTKYDTRLRVLPIKLQTQQTADNRQIIVEGFCTWSVSDPLKFFQRFSNKGERAEDHYTAAENTLSANVRAAMGLVSTYRMGELFNPTIDASKIPELETKILQSFRVAADDSGLSLADYGIEVRGVGISRIVLPETTTSAVFDAMKTSKERQVKETQSQGEAEAAAIRARADSDAARILAFADRLASEIKTQGDIESAPFLAQMNGNAELAVFLQDIEFIRKLPGRKITMVLPTSLPGINLLNFNVMDGLKPGQIPGFTDLQHKLSPPGGAEAPR